MYVVELVPTLVQGPEAPTVSNDGPACEGEDVMVMASTVPGATYLWNGPNGFSSTEQNFVLNNVTIDLLSVDFRIKRLFDFFANYGG